MEPTAIAGMLNAILRSASFVQALGNSYYAHSAAWEVFPTKVDELRRKSKTWSTLVIKLGLDDWCDALISNLREAERLLKEQEDELAKQRENSRKEEMKKEKKEKNKEKKGKWGVKRKQEVTGKEQEEEKEEQDEVLKQTERKQEKRKGKLTTTIKAIIFPVTIGLSIDKVIECFEKIPVNIKYRQDATMLAENEALNRQDSLDFEEDNRYVPLERTERAVRKLLTQPNCKLVLLHGPSGRGKSTLARNLALEIQSVKKRRGIQSTLEILSLQSDSRIASDPSSSRPAALSATIDSDPSISRPDSRVTSEPEVLPISSDPSAPTSNDSKAIHETFNEVVFLECGEERSKNEILDLQLELRQKLGWRLEISKDKTSLLSTRDVQISLKGQLRNRKLLIVLDDVWKSDLIREMLKTAKEATNVKFLVTSQDPSLCQGLKQAMYAPILMEAASLSDATKILVHHMFHPEDEDKPEDIPTDTQACIGEIIELVGSNLLAIACVGAARFDSTDFGKLELWEEVKEELIGWLQRNSRAGIQGKNHPLSYEAALEFAFKRLKEDDERRLLFLIALCWQSSVPQPIVQYLYKLTRDEKQYQPFLDASRTLLGRQFVQRHDDRFSVHSSLKEFLIRNFNQEYQDRILDALSRRNYNRIGPDQDEKDILSAISNLYFQDSVFAKRIAGKVNSSALDDMDNDDMVSTARIIEPISVLAVKEVKKDWTSEMQSNSRQVFWKYVNATVLDGEGTAFLLRQPCAKREMLGTLSDVVSNAKHQKLGAQNIIPKQVLLALVEILTEEQIYIDFIHACSTYDMDSTEVILLQVMDVILVCTGRDIDTGTTNLNNLDQDPNFCAYTTRALQKFLEFLVSEPRLSVEILVIFCVLVQIVGVSNMFLETVHVNMRRAIQKIVTTVSQSQNGDIQASALALAAGEDFPSLQTAAIFSLLCPIMRIAEVAMAADDEDSGSQAWEDRFGSFHSNLLRSYMCELLSIEGAVETLVHASTPSNNEEAKVAALRFLTFMAMFGGQDACTKIYETTESMSNLLNALGTKGASELQDGAANALEALLHVTDEADFCPKIASVNGAVQVMVDALAASNPESVQEAAAHIFQALVRVYALPLLTSR